MLAWGIAWVVASLAYGPGGRVRAYLYQTQRAPKCKRLLTGVGQPTAHSNQKDRETKQGEQSMSQENKTVFHVIREKAAAKVVVALLAAALLAGAGLAWP